MTGTLTTTQMIFGRLTWDSFPWHEPIVVATFCAVVLGGAAVVGAAVAGGMH